MAPKLEQVNKGSADLLKWAKQYGVKIAWGTDLFGPPAKQAMQNQEFVARSTAFSPVEILRQATSGNAELFIEAFRLRGDKRLMDTARLFGSALLEPHGKTYRVQLALGNYRYPPGYMLGLAGIGHYFLRLAAPEKTPLPLMVR